MTPGEHAAHSEPSTAQEHRVNGVDDVIHAQQVFSPRRFQDWMTWLQVHVVGRIDEESVDVSESTGWGWIVWRVHPQVGQMRRAPARLDLDHVELLRVIVAAPAPVDKRPGLSRFWVGLAVHADAPVAMQGLVITRAQMVICAAVVVAEFFALVHGVATAILLAFLVAGAAALVGGSLWYRRSYRDRLYRSVDTSSEIGVMARLAQLYALVDEAPTVGDLQVPQAIHALMWALVDPGATRAQQDQIISSADDLGPALNEVIHAQQEQQRLFDHLSGNGLRPEHGRPGRLSERPLERSPLAEQIQCRAAALRQITEKTETLLLPDVPQPEEIPTADRHAPTLRTTTHQTAPVAMTPGERR